MPDYCLNAPFRKPGEYNGLDYEKQKEYRFAWRLNSELSIERFALYVNPKEYIKNIYVNSNVDLKHVILTGLITWNMNIDVLRNVIGDVSKRDRFPNELGNGIENLL